MQRNGEHTYSVRLVKPFLRVLRGRGAFPDDILDALAGQSPDDRVPIRLVLQSLDAAVALSGDPDLGLHAADSIERGHFDVLEFAASSCRTWGDGLAAALRYISLVNDAAEFTVDTRSERAVLALRSAVPLTRAAADFQVGAFARGFVVWLGEQVPTPETEIWFEHPAPADTSAYATTFRGVPIRFGAPVDAIVFDRAHLTRPLATADPELHRVLRQHADDLLQSLPRVERVSELVRREVAAVLAGGNTGVDFIAERLGMSRRTLARRLGEEGTTYTELLDQMRRGMATQYLAATTLPLHEVAFLLGFNDAPAFSRAFKRWLDTTPGDYRTKARAG